MGNTFRSLYSLVTRNLKLLWWLSPQEQQSSIELNAKDQEGKWETEKETFREVYLVYQPGFWTERLKSANQSRCVFQPDYKIADPVCTFIFSILVLVSTIMILKDFSILLMEGRRAFIIIPRIDASFPLWS